MAAHADTRSVEALPGPRALPEMIAERVLPGDLVICLGAGTITKESVTRRAEGADARQRRLGDGHGSYINSDALLDRLPAVRGRYEVNADLSGRSWFAPVVRRVLFEPEDAEDLQLFLAERSCDVPITVIGLAQICWYDGGETALSSCSATRSPMSL